MCYYLFVYGTLKKGYGLNYCLKDGLFIGNAIIKGYEMYYNYSIPFIKEGNGLIHGEVYKFSKKDFNSLIKDLDRIEGSYKRVLEVAYINKKSLLCFVYVYLYDVDHYIKIKSGKFR